MSVPPHLRTVHGIRRGDLIAAGALLLFGIVLSIESLKFALWRENTPGPGFVPLVIGLCLVAGTSAWVAGLWLGGGRPGSAAGPDADPGVDAAEPGGAHRLTIGAVLLVGYALAFSLAGYLPATAVFTALFLRLLSGLGWPVALAGGVLAATLTYALFGLLLAVPLPMLP